MVRSAAAARLSSAARPKVGPPGLRERAAAVDQRRRRRAEDQRRDAVRRRGVDGVDHVVGAGVDDGGDVDADAGDEDPPRAGAQSLVGGLRR